MANNERLHGWRKAAAVTALALGGGAFLHGVMYAVENTLRIKDAHEKAASLAPKTSFKRYDRIYDSKNLTEEDRIATMLEVSGGAIVLAYAASRLFPEKQRHLRKKIPAVK